MSLASMCNHVSSFEASILTQLLNTGYRWDCIETDLPCLDRQAQTVMLSRLTLVPCIIIKSILYILNLDQSVGSEMWWAAGGLIASELYSLPRTVLI